MSDRDAFLRAIIADPDDDAPRLVFADWLGENGDPDRAEFIRLQCRIAANDPTDTVSDDWFRQDDLAEAQGDRWRDEVPLTFPARWVGWERGFPARVRFTWPTAFRLDSVAVRQLLPVIWAEVQHYQFDADDLAHGGPLAGWPALDFSFLHEPRRLVECPEIAGLRGLLLVSSGGDDTVTTLAASPRLAGLQLLELRGGGMTARSAEALADSPHMAGLRSLTLAGMNPWNPPVPIGPAGVAALAQSPWLRPAYLDVCAVGLGDDTAALAGPATTGVCTLGLGGNDIGPAGIAALIAALPAGPRRLWLMRNPLGDEGIRVLAASPWLATVADLDMFECDVTDAGVCVLANSPHAASLRRLNLRSATLAGESLSALAGSPYLGRLVELQLDATRSDEAGDSFAVGLRKLAWSDRLPSLRRLDVIQNDLGIDVLRMLADSPLAGRLTRLEFEDITGGLSAEAARLLADRATWPNLVRRPVTR